MLSIPVTPAVSVVIPTHNRRMLVRDAIESVLAQCNVALELIVVDDGSIDGTAAELMPAYADRVRWICTENRGPAAARNAGVAIASGEFVAFLDSDDRWMPAKLERQIAFMRANPACRISQCQERWLRNGRQVNPGQRHLKRGGDIFLESLSTCLVSPSAVIMHRDLFREIGGFDETMQACEDYDLWLRILADTEIALLDEILVIRRGGHPGQLSATVPALDRFRILSIMKLLAGLRLTPDRRVAAYAVLIEKIAIYANGLERRGKIEAAQACRSIVRESSRIWREAPDAALFEAIDLMRQMIQQNTAMLSSAANPNTI
ncbi:MAG: glycosyltransferase [Candidatus Binataceae bacterium]|nr:glycosyltransferase [Candidatus Binataceae bacterium]